MTFVYIGIDKEQGLFHLPAFSFWESNCKFLILRKH